MIKDIEEELKLKHTLEFIAVKNAIGQAFSKNYRYIDVFKKEAESIELSEDEYEDIKNELDW